MWQIHLDFAGGKLKMKFRSFLTLLQYGGNLSVSSTKVKKISDIIWELLQIFDDFLPQRNTDKVIGDW